MLLQVHPKLPMRNKEITRNFYIHGLGFKDIGMMDYAAYLILEKDQVQLHFFEHTTLNPLENDGQVYIRVSQLEIWFEEVLQRGITKPLQGKPEIKPWGQKEFSMLDPDHNLLTFGEKI